MQRVGRKRIYVVPVLMRTFDILELLCGSDVALNSNEISNATDIPHTTTYRILQTLLLRGYVTQNHSGKFSIRSQLAKDPISAPTADSQDCRDLLHIDNTLISDQAVAVLKTVLQTLRHSNEGSLDCKI